MRRVFCSIIVVILGSACVEPKFTPVTLPECDITWQPLVVGKSFKEAFYDPTVSSRHEFRAGGIASDGIYRELVVINNGDVPAGVESQRTLNSALTPGEGVALQVHVVTTEKSTSDLDDPDTLLHEGGIGHVFYPVSGNLGITVPVANKGKFELSITDGIFQEVGMQGSPIERGLRLCIPSSGRMAVEETAKWPCTRKVLLDAAWPLRLIEEAYTSVNKATACKCTGAGISTICRTAECKDATLTVTTCAESALCHPADNTQAPEGTEPACVGTTKTLVNAPITTNPLAFYDTGVLNAHYGEVSDATQRIAVIRKGDAPALALNTTLGLSGDNILPDKCKWCVVGTRTVSGVTTTYFARSGSVTLKTALPTPTPISGTFNVFLQNLVLQEVDSQFNLKPGGKAWIVGSATINTAVRTAGWPCDNLSAVEWASGPQNGWITQAGLDPRTASLRLPSNLFGSVCVPLSSPIILGCTSQNLTNTPCTTSPNTTCSPATNRILAASCVAPPQ